MTTIGRLEVTIKISELPQNVRTVGDSKTFDLECDRCIVSVTVKPKVWRKLEEAQANFPQWVAAITGKMGEATAQGFVLEAPAVQVFEKKPKAVAEQPAEKVLNAVKGS